MFAVKESLIIVGALSIIGSAVREIRSPDKMEINIPNYTHDKDSGEYEDNMNQETAYWQGQGDKVGDREEEGHQQLTEDRDKNQENYENEKEHHKEQQHSYNKEMNESYQDDRDKAEAHHESNQEHYMEYQSNTNHDITSQGNKTAEDLIDNETGDRYEEKGTEFVENEQDKIENHDVNGDSPSISYSKT